jgi:hypothetical protein
MNAQETLSQVADQLRQLPASRRALGANPLFTNVQKLDGFDVGFMSDEQLEALGIDPETTEVIMMHTVRATTPHVHGMGNSVFMPLGARDGFPESGGGTYLGPYKEGSDKFKLDFVPAVEGETFDVAPGTVHFFSPEEAQCLDAIAVVSPRIKQGDGSFDITRFRNNVEFSDDRRQAVVTAL